MLTVLIMPVYEPDLECGCCFGDLDHVVICFDRVETVCVPGRIWEGLSGAAQVGLIAEFSRNYDAEEAITASL